MKSPAFAYLSKTLQVLKYNYSKPVEEAQRLKALFVEKKERQPQT